LKNKKPYLICPSILAANYMHLGRDVKEVLLAGADRIHVDVMDNHYVPNLSFGPAVVSALLADGVEAPIDVHLMASPVDQLIIAFSKAGASLIYIHPESTIHLDRSIELIKSLGCKVGLAFNPTTPLEYLNYTLDKIDNILLMSVNPGFGGQEFIESSIRKIQDIDKLIENHNLDIVLEVDGGVNPSNIRSIADAGATAFVMGSAIFSSESFAGVIKKCRETLI
jgi:ribulose-phosphate 3-epimerase